MADFNPFVEDGGFNPFEEDTSPTAPNKKAAPSSGSIAREAAAEIGKRLVSTTGEAIHGIIDVAATGAGAFVGKAVEGAGIAAQTAGIGSQGLIDAGKAMQYQPQSDTGKTLLAPVEYVLGKWHEGAVSVGDSSQEGVRWLLEDQFGLSPEAASETASIFATAAYSSLEIIPYIAGIRGAKVGPEAVPKHVGDRGFVPPEFQTQEQIAAADRGKKTYTKYEKPTAVEESTFDFSKEGGPAGVSIASTIKDEKGSPIGKVEATWEQGTDTIRVHEGDVTPTTKAFSELADYATSRGVKLGSDKEVALENSHVYENLQKEGYAVEQNPTAYLDVTYGMDGKAKARMLSEDGNPIFTIKGKGKSAPVNIGAVKEAITLDEQGVKRIDFETPAPIIENATSKAIREAVVNRQAELDLQKKGITYDERPIEKVIPELIQTTKETMPDGSVRSISKGKQADLPNRFGAETGIQNIFTNPETFIPTQMIARYRDNKIMTWGMSLVNKANRGIEKTLEQIFYAPEVKLRGGWRVVRKPTERGLKASREKLSQIERDKLAKEIFDYDDMSAKELPSRDELGARGWSEKMMNWFYNFHAQKSEQIRLYNQEAAKHDPNFVPLKDAPGVVPHMWDSSAPYRVALRPKGETSAHIQLAAKTAAQADKLKARLEEVYGTDKFEVSIKEQKLDRQFERNASARALSEAIEILQHRERSGDVPTAQAEAVGKVLQDLHIAGGIKAHTKQRTGARGYMGDQFTGPLSDSWGKATSEITKEFENATDAFFTGIVRSRGYFEVKKGMKEFNSNNVLQEVYPNTSKFLNTYVDNFYGRETFLDGQLKKIAGDYSGVIKGITAPVLYTKILFWNAGQVLANSSQFVMAMPRAWREASAGKEGREVAKASIQTLRDFVSPSPEKRASLKWASDNGVISQNYIRMMEDKDFSGKVYTNPSAVWDMFSGRMLSNVIEESTRLVSFNVYENLLLNKGVPLEIARKDAANLVDISQVNYNFHERGLMWSGDLGRLPGQFKTWSANWMGQFAEYIKDAKAGESEPLIGFLAATGAVSGLLGMVGVKEADTAVDLYNKVTQNNVQLPSATLALHAPDILAYGPIQTAANFHAATFDAPQASLQSILYVPGYNFYKPIAEDLYNIMLKATGASEVPFSRQDWQRFVYDTAPTVLRGTLNMVFETGDIKLLKPGERKVYHDPRTGEALITMDHIDERAKILGGDSLKMATMKNMLFSIQRLEQNRTSTIDTWADYVAVTQYLYKVPMDLTPFYKIAADFKVSGNEFNKMVKERGTKMLKDRNVRAVQSKLGKRHIDELRPYLDNLSAKEEAKGSFEEQNKPFDPFE
jgi:hypothetical protein